MSSSIDLRVSRSLELLADLHRTVADFAKREAQLTRDLGSRRHAITRKQREALEKMDSKFRGEADAAREVLDAEEERVRSIFERRRARIQRLHETGLRNLPKRARAAKESWKGDLQLKHFRADRGLAASLEAADKAFQSFIEKLAGQRAKVVELQTRALKVFRGYPAFQRLLREEAKAAPEASTDPANQKQRFEDLEARLATAEEQLGAFRSALLPRLFGYLPLPMLLPLILGGGVVLAALLGFHATGLSVAGAMTAVLLLAVCAAYLLGLRRAKPIVQKMAGALAEGSRLHDACLAAANLKHERDRQRAQESFDRTNEEIRQQWGRAESIESEFENAARKKLETQVPRAFERNARFLAPKVSRLAEERRARLDELTQAADARKQQLSDVHVGEAATLATEDSARWAELEAEWQRDTGPLFHALETMNAVAATCFPAWTERTIYTWSPLEEFLPAVKFGQLDLDLARHGIPKDPRLALPVPAQVSIPLTLTFPEQGSLLFETNDSANAAVLGTLNNIILRLLAITPPGKLAFTIIDPVGLGQSFAGLMHLGDYEESLINRRIWTQRDQIEDRLAELNEHIEKVIQMYLRTEFANITEYNEQAGSVAEKYHFLVVADFPANFSEMAAKRLQSIAASGPRCGVFTLMHWDNRHPVPDGAVPEELRKNSVCIRREGEALIIDRALAQSGAVLSFEEPPESDLAAALVHRIGKSSVDSNRVEVPFAQIAPAPAQMWSEDTTNELRVAIGRTGATKHQYLAIGKGTRQHALFAGKTGSGKSTLFHVIITNLALACSPDQVEFYLIDFKKGVEFKCYAEKRLPHARVVAIESDREFALSVLQRVDEELKRRGDIFRKLGVQDIPGYKRAGGVDPMPRSLLLIDEFQEFFVEDDAIAQIASLLFDRIVRQGRAFGIHVLLGSQSLGGAYSLARATIGQMVIRVALQCNEADAYLIMDDTNSAPRLLSRPGEGIYNDAGGSLEGNSPFQVVWLPDDERDRWLDTVRELAVQRHDSHRGPIVFEGNSPADIRENHLLRAVLDAPGTSAPAAPRAWLGAPNSIKGPTEVVFHRQSGNHLLIIGQREEAALTLLGVSLLALAAQYPVGGTRFVFLHQATPESAEAELVERVIAAIPHQVTVAHSQELGDVMAEFGAAMKARSGGEHATNAPPIFLFIHGLHRFKKLRHEDDFSFSTSDSEETANPGAQLNDLIAEGSSQGIHLLATIDTLNNINRFMSRKALSEFEMRVVFQMSANDSASLIDSPKASDLGLHRALFYNEHEGTLETFRPYATPDAEWFRHAGEKLGKLPASA